MDQYLQLLSEVLEHGHRKTDRTGTGTLSLFGRQLRFDLQAGFPAVTTKRLFWRGVVEELLWFIRGSTNAHELSERGVHIWDAWADADGELGPVYGAQWRRWRTADGRQIDQLQRLLEELRTHPDSRRHLVSAWNVGELEEMNLPPCHLLFQFYVAEGRLSCLLYQRSADLFLGLPFNIASYSLLTHLIARHVGLEVGEFVWSGGDCHLYLNHVEQAREQLSRTPRALPQLHISAPTNDLFCARSADLQLVGYDPHPHIPAPIAV
ncbi:thymidylate synthase [Halorhodospira abdelmalekii]|uniref:thymidylate synthase n=1 Tax=Halorhodospira abdelmalekii TaxID=421629 RepID=UPI00190895AD|nr:thymidylate synthase [Halorhodospira abdelmalekii]MBK1735536.1 thymidylate synthase [Halorhodospira abdelmalekii]